MNKLREQDWFVYDEIFVHNVYGLTETDLKDATVLDIGANKGFFTVFAVTNGAKEVIAVEPGNKQYRKLLENTADYSNVQRMRVAVSNEAGKELFLTDEDGSSKLNDNTGEKVYTITLDWLIPNEPNLILKMDIEGAEERVVFSNTEILKKFKIICMEIHNNRKSILVEKIASLGFDGQCLSVLYNQEGPIGVETWKFRRTI